MAGIHPLHSSLVFMLFIIFNNVKPKVKTRTNHLLFELSFLQDTWVTCQSWSNAFAPLNFKLIQKEPCSVLFNVSRLEYNQIKAKILTLCLIFVLSVLTFTHIVRLK